MKKVLLFCILIINILAANEKVSLQLKWFHQFQFAGYYAAKEKGFYSDAGLDVEIKQRDLKYNNIEQVIKGESQYGVADSVLLLYKGKKRPVVIVSPIFQHSPSVLITTKEKGIDTPFLLESKKIRSYKKETDGFGITAMFESMKINPVLERKKGDNDIDALLEGKIDALAGYITNEPYYFKEKSIDVNIINPANYGFDLYGDMLFTNEKEAKQNPDRVRRFKEATLKGWRYALKNKGEMIRLIKEKYAKNKSLKHLKYEADTLEQLIQHRTIPLGSLDKGRLQYLLSIYQKHGLIKNDIPIDDYIFSHKGNISLTKEEKEWLRNNPEINFAAIKAQKPLIMEDSRGNITGIIPDYFKVISSLIPYSKIKLNVVKEGQNEHVAAKKSPNMGLAAAVIFKENEKEYLLSDPYMETYFVVFTNKNNRGKINSLEDLEGKKIALLKNHKAMKKHFSKIKGIKIIETSSPYKQMDMLQYKEVDAIVGYDTYHYLINEYLFTDIITAFNIDRPINIGVAINKEHAVLKGIIDKALVGLNVQKKQSIISKWIHKGGEEHNLLSKKESEYLKAKKSIKMCIDPDWMPFEKNDKGVHTGMSADYISILQKYIPVPIKMVPTNTWAESLALGQKRECDIFSLVMPTPKRKKYLDFTKPYLKVPLVIVTASEEPFINDVSKVTDKKIGIVKGYAYGEILREKYPKMQLVDVDNVKDGLKKVDRGEYFGFIGTIATSGYEIQKNYVGHIKIAGKFDESWDLGIATRNDEPLLKDIFEKAIENVTASEHQEILNKWVSVKFDKQNDLNDIVKWILIVVLLAVLIIFIILKRAKIVKKELDEKLRIEKELLDLQKQFSEAQKLAHLGSWKWDIKRNKVFWSNETFRILGEEPQSFNPSFKKMMRYIPKEQHFMIEEVIESAVKDRKDFEIEHKIIRDNGETLYVKEAGTTTYDGEGEPLYMVGSILDITPVKLHEVQEEIRITKITNYQNALLQLSKVDYQNLEDAVLLSTEVTAKTLGVDRTSIWLFKDDKTRLQTITQYSLIDNKHTNGVELKEEDYPIYFKTIKGALSIVADNVNTNDIAKNLKEKYLIPNNIYSILYNPIVSRGEIIGVLCIENTFVHKRWSAEDTEFAVAISNSISLAFEIENRKKVENELENTLELFNLGETILFKWKNDQSWSIDYVSDNAGKVLGYELGDIVSEKIKYSELIHEDDIDRVIAEVGENMDKESFFHEPYRVKKGDNKYIWVTDTTKIIRDDKGNITHFLGYIRDITNEMKQKKDLEVSNMNLVKSEKMAALGQLVANIAHEINSPLGAINSSIESSSSELERFINQYASLLESMNDKERVIVFDIIDNLTQKQGFVSSSQERAYKKEIISMLKDIKIDNPRVVADKLIRLKIYDGSYFKKILPVLYSNNSQDIIDTLLIVAKLFSNNYNIQEAIKASTKTILALKSYSHTMDEKISVTTKKLKTTIDTVLTIYHNKIKYAVKLDYEFEDLEPIKANHDELTQVWTNLIHNALYAMDNQGELKIKIYKKGDLQIVEVCDSGCGMSEETKSKIFEPFFTTKPAGVGSGLGLDIIKNIIEKHNGSIDVESKEGEGSTFRVKIPVVI